MGRESANYTHMLAEAMRGSISDRMLAVGDPAFVPDRTAELLARARLEARRAQIGYDRTHAPVRFAELDRGTSHLVVGDAKGNVVSLSTTINNPFGSGIVAPRAGVLLNDELSDFTDPDVAARFGPRPGPNAPRAGARPVSSMTPVVVLRDGVPVFAAGGSGGARIPVNVTQVLLCRLVFGKSLTSCVGAPRFFTPLGGPSLEYNAEQLPPATVQLDLLERGEQIRLLASEDITAVQAVAFEKSGSTLRLSAAGDPRKGGVGLGR
jgi:gamma-glutamyltranspeptidase/glutathione hydrolase